MANERDELGLLIDSSDVLASPPGCILYGPAGAGKSRAAASAFQNTLYVQSSSTVLLPHAAQIRKEGKGSKLKMPTRVTIPKTSATGDLIDPRPSLNKILTMWRETAANGKNPYDCIVFDEWTDFAGRINAAIQNDSATYGNNGFAKVEAFKEFHRQLALLPQQTGRAMILICHEQPPLYDMKGDSGPKGAILIPGGPAMANKRLSAEISAMMDVVLRIVITQTSTGKTMRRFATEISPTWTCKLRGAGFSDLESVDDGLRGLLEKAGYALPTWK